MKKPDWIIHYVANGAVCELPYLMQLMETDAYNLFRGHDHETEESDGK